MRHSSRRLRKRPRRRYISRKRGGEVPLNGRDLASTPSRFGWIPSIFTRKQGKSWRPSWSNWSFTRKRNAPEAKVVTEEDWVRYPGGKEQVRLEKYGLLDKPSTGLFSKDVKKDSLFDEWDREGRDMERGRRDTRRRLGGPRTPVNRVEVDKFPLYKPEPLKGYDFSNVGSVAPVKPGEQNVWSSETIKVKETDPWAQITNPFDVPEDWNTSGTKTGPVLDWGGSRLRRHKKRTHRRRR